MNIKEKEITETKKTYELTEEEYNKLLEDRYFEGVSDLASYIQFCIQNDGLDSIIDDPVINSYWGILILKRMIKFFNDQRYMENSKGIAFYNYIKQYGFYNKRKEK